MMKKILLTVAAVAAVTAAVPAAAQSHDRDGRGGYDQRRDNDRRGGAERYNPNEYGNRRWNDGSRREWIQARRIDEREAQIAQRIDTAARRGALTPGEARSFFIKLQNVETLERNYKRHNRDLTNGEVKILNYRMDLLQREIRYKVRN
ncbi:MAG: hypothetical protein EON95_12560 [Caulobacteraceae bacterium]|nr:MAG: hypothetical protein EON95_12560 [Caulobacteraceae bacterium]